MPTQIEFWFEFASTYSYPAAMQVEQACADAGVDLVWRPFLLGPIFAAQGMTDSPFNIYPTKGRYMWRDMERLCLDAGLPLKRPSVFPRGSMIATRIACAHGTAPWVGAFVRAVYHANFAEDRDIGAEEVLTPLLTGLDLNADTILSTAQEPATKDALRRQTERAGEMGIFGAPSFTVGDELFWGQDRLSMAIDWAKSAT